MPRGGAPAVCRSPLRVPSGRVTPHTPRDVKAAQVGCGARGRARLGLDTRGRLVSRTGGSFNLSLILQLCLQRDGTLQAGNRRLAQRTPS